MVKHLILLACMLLCAACSGKSAPVVADPAPVVQTSSPAHGDDQAQDLPTLSQDTQDLLEDDWDAEYEDLEDDYALMDEQGSATKVADPLEPFNRAMFVVNDKLYFWVLKPTASVYGAIFPQQMRTGIDNVFHNLAFPIRFVSSVLQLKLDKAVKEVGAFAMNTTFGIGGLVRISDHIDPLKDLSPEDLGQTLAHYGVGDGCYIVWPVFGPSTLRDTTGTIGEYFLDPINYIDEWEIRWALEGEKTLNYTSLHPGEYEDLKEAAFDPYEALKDFYIQHHRHLTRE
jgi:phospholipid-binding lipoprotein MlaA